MNLSSERKAAGAAIIVVIVAAFLPWASFLGVAAYGIEGDGQITLVLGLVGVAILAVEALTRRRRWLRIVEWACAIIVTLVGLFDMNGLATVGLYCRFAEQPQAPRLLHRPADKGAMEKDLVNIRPLAADAADLRASLLGVDEIDDPHQAERILDAFEDSSPDDPTERPDQPPGLRRSYATLRR